MRFAFPLAAAAVAVVMLSGCVPEGTDVVPPPATSADPVFASDEEALAAATEAYTAYLAMSDLIAQEGGKDPERIAPYVTEEWLEQELKQFSQQVESKTRQQGQVAIAASEFQWQDPRSGDGFHVGAYYCLDFAAVRFLDANGSDVTPTDRRSQVTTEVLFAGTATDEALLVDGIHPWLGSGIC